MKKIASLGLILASTMAFAGNEPTQSLSSKIPYPFYEVQKSSKGKHNRMIILNSGVAALEKRLQLIRRAEKTIEVEYFIYATDESSRLLTQALVAAAKRGVKVRILVDKSAAIFALDEYYAKALHEVKDENGNETDIQVKYYNGASLIRLSSINFRNHRKLLSVDNRYAITGGRNVENDYYDLADDFNFLDRDVYISGDIVPTIVKSFDKYFNHKISETAKLPKRPKDTVRERYKERNSIVTKYRNVPNIKKINAFNKKMNVAIDFITENQKDIELKEIVARAGGNILSKKVTHKCPEVTFSTDAPGGNFLTRLFEKYGENYRFLRKTLHDKMADPELTSVVISSPYMIHTDYSSALVDSMVQRNVDVTLYTNTLASTDAVYVAANLYKDFIGWAKAGVRIFAHDGLYLDEGEAPLKPSLKTAMWGTHSKTQLYETKTNTEVMIGTYNVDNRSSHYNSEMAVFCKGSPEIAAEVKHSMAHRLRNSYQFNEDETATNRSNEEVSIYGASEDKLKLMKTIAIPSWLLKDLL